MHAAMHAIERGDAHARVGAVGSEDELGIVAAHFDRLLDQLQAQTDALRRWGDSLDGKVAERTAELEQAVTNLKAAQSLGIRTIRVTPDSSLPALRELERVVGMPPGKYRANTPE